MYRKVSDFSEDKINYFKLLEIFQGWNAYAKWANTYILRKDTLKKIAIIKNKKIEEIKQKKNSLFSYL